MNQISRNKEIKLSKFLGLCSTCNYSRTCIHNKRNGFLKLYCEEFDNYISEKKIKKRYMPVKEQPEDLMEKKIKVFLGLCRNCDFSETCTHLKPESGVWHCEDYS